MSHVDYIEEIVRSMNARNSRLSQINKTDFKQIKIIDVESIVSLYDPSCFYKQIDLSDANSILLEIERRSGKFRHKFVKTNDLLNKNYEEKISLMLKL